MFADLKAVYWELNRVGRVVKRSVVHLDEWVLDSEVHRNEVS